MDLRRRLVTCIHPDSFWVATTDEHLEYLLAKPFDLDCGHKTHRIYSLWDLAYDLAN